MPKRIKKPKRPNDVNQLAHRLVSESTSDTQPPPTKDEISRVMAALGRRGGKNSGKKRMTNLTPEKRREIASLAAKARWKKEQDAKQQ
jgi:hypothetical protein